MESKNQYLNYIDREMTIMGILSTFCVALLALIFDKLIGITPQQLYLTQIWDCGLIYIVLACTAILFSAGFFYKQRANLAGYYGYISKAVDRSEEEEIKRCTDEVNYWSFWLWHDAGFASIWFAILNIIYAASSPQCTFLSSAKGGVIVSTITLLIFITIFGFHSYVYCKFKSEDSAYGIWWQSCNCK